jgi:two-component system, NtrC family, response regulator HydG
MSSPSVLVLDDDLAVCRVINRMLSLEAYEVRTSQSVEEAVNAIEEKSFDAYVLDYRLNDGDGLEVAERLRAKGSGAPIILISGYDLRGIAARAESLGVFGMIEKPFSVDALFNALKQSIELASAKNRRGAEQEESKIAESPETTKRSAKTAQVVAVILLVLLLAVMIYVILTGH